MNWILGLNDKLLHFLGGVFGATVLTAIWMMMLYTAGSTPGWRAMTWMVVLGGVSLAQIGWELRSWYEKYTRLLPVTRHVVLASIMDTLWSLSGGATVLLVAGLTGLV